MKLFRFFDANFPHSSVINGSVLWPFLILANKFSFLPLFSLLQQVRYEMPILFPFPLLWCLVPPIKEHWFVGKVQVNLRRKQLPGKKGNGSFSRAPFGKEGFSADAAFGAVRNSSFEQFVMLLVKNIGWFFFLSCISFSSNLSAFLFVHCLSFLHQHSIHPARHWSR